MLADALASSIISLPARYVNENIFKVLKVDSSLFQHVRVVVLGAKKKRALIRVRVDILNFELRVIIREHCGAMRM